jgi:type I restriction enzyme R subunit
VDIPQNAKKNADKQNARIEQDKTLASPTELFKQFSDNPAFRRWLGDTVFSMTYETPDLRP